MRYRLKLKRLDWISPVDVPAQETARVLMIKRKAVEGFARAVKVDESLGLVFCWAFTSKHNGSDYYDLQNDNVDEDFIKAAADFMENGGRSDEMHNGISDGRVVFAMPMTSEIASAFGVTSKTTGLMVALKPSADVLAKFKSGEYTGVSIEGLGEREQQKRAPLGQPGCAPLVQPGENTVKRALLTTATAGHVHMLNDGGDAPAGETDYRSMPGETDGGYHSHPWVRSSDGVIVLGESENHTHVVLSPEDIDAIVAGGEADVDEDDAGAAKRAGILTPSTAAHEAGTTNQETAVDPKELKKALDEANAKNVELEKRNGALGRMSSVAFAVWKSLTGADAEAFLAKPDPDRAPQIAEFEKSNAVEYTATDGTVYTKRDDPRLVAMAKRADSEVAKREAIELAKRADTELGGFGGTTEHRGELLRVIGGISDQPTRDAVLGIVKGASAGLAHLTKFSGVRLPEGVILPENGATPPPQPVSPVLKAQADLEKRVKEYQAEQKLPSYEQAYAKAASSDPKTRELLTALRGN